MRITHPFHPACGEEFELIRTWRWRDEERALLATADGAPFGVPGAWTSLAAPEPFVVVSAGRACFRPVDLTRLADLIEGLRESPAGGPEGGGV